MIDASAANGEVKTGAMPPAMRVLLLVVLAAGIFTRSYHLGDKILWIDEGINWKVASFRTVGEIVDYNMNEEHSPLPQIISHYWVGAFGDSVKALHSESLMWSILALFVFTYLAFRFLCWEAAFGAVTVLSLSAFVPEYAQTMRYPALGQFVSSLWWVGLLTYRRNGSTRGIALFCAALSVALYVHLYAVFTVAALMMFFVVWGKGFGRSVMPLLVSCAAALAAISPKYLLMKNSGVDALAHSIPLSSALSHLMQIPVGGIVRILLDFCVGRANPLETLHAPLAVLILLVVAGLSAASLFHKKHGYEARLCMTLVAVPMLLGWLGMIFKGFYFQSQYYFPPFLPFCIMLGLGADTIRRWKPAAAPALFVCFVVFSLFCINSYWKKLDRPENIKSVLEYAAANERPGDFVNVSPPYTFHFDYYWKGKSPVRDFSDDYDPLTTPHNNYVLIFADKNQIDEARMRRWDRDVGAKHKRVWMFWVTGVRNTEDKNGFAKRWMDSHYKKIIEKPYRMFPFMDDYTGELALYETGGPR